MFDNILFSGHGSAKLSPVGGFPLDSLAKSGYPLLHMQDSLAKSGFSSLHMQDSLAKSGFPSLHIQDSLLKKWIPFIRYVGFPREKVDSFHYIYRIPS